MEIDVILNNEAAIDIVTELSAENHLRIAQHLSALYNSNGGYLILGINHKSKVKGCEPSAEFSNLNIAIENYLHPTVKIETSILQKGPKLLLLAKVEKSENHLVSVKVLLNKEQCYIRKNNETVLANKIIEQVLLLQLNNTIINKEDSYIRHETIELLSEGCFSLSQIYSEINFEKKLIDTTLIQMLFFKEIDFDIKNEVIQFFIKN